MAKGRRAKKGEESSHFSLAALESMLETGRTRLDKLHQRETDLTAELEAVRDEIRVLSGGSDNSAVPREANRRRGRGGRGVRTVRRGGKRPRNEKSLPVVLEEVLREGGKPMRVGEITDAVLATGYKSGSSSFRAIVNQTLVKDSRFKTSSRGEYVLTDAQTSA